jgi:hypothetical protein
LRCRAASCRPACAHVQECGCAGRARCKSAVHVRCICGTH